MTPEEIAADLWGWERTRLKEIVGLRHPTSSENVAPGKAVDRGLVQVRVDRNDTTGTATLTWEASDLGKEVAALLDA